MHGRSDEEAAPLGGRHVHPRAQRRQRARQPGRGLRQEQRTAAAASTNTTARTPNTQSVGRGDELDQQARADRAERRARAPGRRC